MDIFPMNHALSANFSSVHMFEFQHRSFLEQRGSGLKLSKLSLNTCQCHPTHHPEFCPIHLSRFYTHLGKHSACFGKGDVDRLESEAQ
jgi:hypothetical protein